LTQYWQGQSSCTGRLQWQAETGLAFVNANKDQTQILYRASLGKRTCAFYKKVM